MNLIQRLFTLRIDTVDFGHPQMQDAPVSTLTQCAECGDDLLSHGQTDPVLCGKCA
jgi:hypothetical protein